MLVVLGDEGEDPAAAAYLAAGEVWDTEDFSCLGRGLMVH